MDDLVKRARERAGMYDMRTAAIINELADEVERLRADNAFFRQRRGELVIERDRATNALMEWTRGDGPNQQLLEDASNAAMRAAIAEARLAALTKAAEPFAVKGGTLESGGLDGAPDDFLVMFPLSDLRALARACSQAPNENEEKG